jgi:hypothetical protein
LGKKCRLEHCPLRPPTKLSTLGFVNLISSLPVADCTPTCSSESPAKYICPFYPLCSRLPVLQETTKRMRVFHFEEVQKAAGQHLTILSRLPLHLYLLSDSPWASRNQHGSLWTHEIQSSCSWRRVAGRAATSKFTIGCDSSTGLLPQDKMSLGWTRSDSHWACFRRRLQIATRIKGRSCDSHARLVYSG